MSRTVQIGRKRDESSLNLSGVATLSSTFPGSRRGHGHDDMRYHVRIAPAPAEAEASIEPRGKSTPPPVAPMQSRVRARLPAIDVRAPAHIRLANAQLVIARDHGPRSWPRLVRYFNDVDRERHSPRSTSPDGRAFIVMVNPRQVRDFAKATGQLARFADVVRPRSGQSRRRRVVR